MDTILVATDSDSVHAEIDATFASDEVDVFRVRAGRDVRPAVEDLDPDVVILDMQIGAMGGVATCLDLRLEEGAGRLRRHRIVLLLDREADVFLAQESGADDWIVKPLDTTTLTATVVGTRQPR